MTEADRITPEDARIEIQGGRAILVCAYEDEEKCKRINLEYGITFKQFMELKPGLPKDQEIVFYCT